MGYRRGRGRRKCRRQHERRCQARRRHPAVVEDPITLERIASEPGRPHLARSRCGGHGSRREVEETKPPGKRRGVGRLHSTCEASNNAGSRRRRRWWREGGRSKGRCAAPHAPDSGPGLACHRSCEPADRSCTGRLRLGASIALDLRQEPGAGKPHAGICAGCALQARRTQLPEMAAAAKPSEQPRTESCVVSGNGRCEA